MSGRDSPCSRETFLGSEGLSVDCLGVVRWRVLGFRTVLEDFVWADIVTSGD
jgi:hypothetical protein